MAGTRREHGSNMGQSRCTNTVHGTWLAHVFAGGVRRRNPSTPFAPQSGPTRLRDRGERCRGWPHAKHRARIGRTPRRRRGARRSDDRRVKLDVSAFEDGDGDAGRQAAVRTSYRGGSTLGIRFGNRTVQSAATESGSTVTTMDPSACVGTQHHTDPRDTSAKRKLPVPSTADAAAAASGNAVAVTTARENGRSESRRRARDQSCGRSCCRTPRSRLSSPRRSHRDQCSRAHLGSRPR